MSWRERAMRHGSYPRPFIADAIASHARDERGGLCGCPCCDGHREASFAYMERIDRVVEAAAEAVRQCSHDIERGVALVPKGAYQSLVDAQYELRHGLDNPEPFVAEYPCTYDEAFQPCK